jgi:sec-independent protein translocase protein TatA
MNAPSLVLGNIFGNPDGFVIILVVVLLLFGGQKIPELMRGLGKGMGELRKGMEEGRQHFEQAIHEASQEKPAETPVVAPPAESMPRGSAEEPHNPPETTEPQAS